jgi:hypothetical protein
MDYRLRPRLTAAGLVAGRWASMLDVAENDAALVQIVGRQFQRDAITRKNTDVVLLHFARCVCYEFVAVIEVDAETHLGQDFGNEAVHFNQFFFSHNSFREWHGAIAGRRLVPDAASYRYGDKFVKKKPACCGLRFNVMPMLESLLQPMLSAWCGCFGRPCYLRGASNV